MYKMRILFEKKDEAAYISHLDLMRTFQRSFLRAGFDVKYSEGFNPHICMSILSPLATGFRSKYELCDLELLSDGMPENAQERLVAALPRGIIVKSVYPAENKAALMHSSVFEILCEGGCCEKAEEYFNKPHTVTKKSKSGAKQVEIGKYILERKIEQAENGIKLTLRLSMGEDQLNPTYIIDSMRENGVLDAENAFVCTRTAILNEKSELFT